MGQKHRTSPVAFGPVGLAITALTARSALIRSYEEMADHTLRDVGLERSDVRDAALSGAVGPSLARAFRLRRLWRPSSERDARSAGAERDPR